jgi:subtilisin family serine protease
MGRFDVTRRGRRTWIAVALGVVLITAAAAPVEGNSPDEPGASVLETRDGRRVTAPADDDLAQALAASAIGTVRVNVMTNVRTAAETKMSVGQRAAQRSAIARSLAGVEASLAGTNSRVLSSLNTVPALTVEVDRAGLAALRANPAVSSITLDREYGLLLDSSTAVIQSDRLNQAGVLGNGWEGGPGRSRVVVIDTGFARNHNALVGRVVSEACFSAGNACPGGTSQLFGTNAARPCTFSDDCHHGTHVASTALGAAFTGGHEGVARGALLDAIRIGQRNPSTGRWTFPSSDLNNALQRVLNLKNSGNRIISVNISLGGGAFTSECPGNTVDPATDQLTRQLRSAGVAVIAAAGNDGFLNAVSWPACLPTVYAISATDDADNIALFSNSSAKTRWWAPGVEITAAIPGGPNTKATFQGTSMATPHVAGAFALLAECPGNTSPGKIADDLNATGKTINDEGRLRKRINVFQAAVRNVSNNNFANPTFLPSGASDTYRKNTCASAESAEDPVGTPQDTVWFRWIPSRSGTARISTNSVGSKVTTFNTEVTVFTGNTLNTLERVRYDNNSGVGNNSLIVFNATAGTKYRIRVDGVNAENGKFNLHVAPPPV